MTTPTPAPDPADEAPCPQLGDLLEACLRADRALPGSSAAIVEATEGQTRRDLEQMLSAGHALRRNSARLAAASRLPGDRAEALRARIMRRIVDTQPSPPSPSL